METYKLTYNDVDATYTQPELVNYRQNIGRSRIFTHTERKWAAAGRKAHSHLVISLVSSKWRIPVF